MKHYKSLLIAFCLLTAISCHENVQRPASEYQTMIYSFLDEIKAKNENYLQQVTEVERAINFRSLKKFDLATTEDLLIAELSPVQKLGQTSNQKAIFFLNSGQVVRAQLVALEGSGSIGGNEVVQAILNRKSLGNYSGNISFYSVFQKIQFSSAFTDGKLEKEGIARKVASATQKSGRAQACTDWYYIETYHYAGGQTSTVETYLFTTCDEPCGLAGARVNCGGGGGGGGASTPYSQFPQNPQDGDTYETTDPEGFYTKYVYDAARSIWVGVMRVLPCIVLQDNPAAYPFLQNIGWPVNGQVVFGPDGMAYTYNGGSASWTGEVEAGINCASFKFVKTTTDAYWQESAIVDIKLNVFVLDAGTGRVKSRPHTITRPVWFGIPTKLANGEIIQPGKASEMAAVAVTLAHRDIANDYIDRDFVSDAQIENDFVNYVSLYLQAISGKCDFHGSGSPLVTPQNADYLIFGNGDCY